MARNIATVTVCSILLWNGATLASQDTCNQLRIAAFKVYASCVEGVVAKDAVADFNEPVAFETCRHAYFQKWQTFQTKASVAGSTCIGLRFTDNGDGTVSDHLSGLVWEQKTNHDSTQNYADPHDADNNYTWSAGSPYAENGTAFADFLISLNSGSGFAGSNGWRLPTLAELQTIVLDRACRGACQCPSLPCNDPVFTTAAGGYTSASGYVPNPADAWTVDFGSEFVAPDLKTQTFFIRAVRGGF